MTKEEVKRTYSMRDIAGRYGLRPNRAGFISCPFHTEKTASMKLYEDSYYCFGCGANGDIFTFVQHMDEIDFKEAFGSLGGTYDGATFSSGLSVYHARKRMAMRKKEKLRLLEMRESNQALITIYREYVRKAPPLSKVWCDCWNALQVELYKHSELNGLESRW